MNNTARTLITSSALAVGLSFLTSTQAQASTFSLNFDSTSQSSNNPATGAAATIDFGFADAGAGVVNLTLGIKNTTGETNFGAGATSSRLTAVLFDLVPNVSYQAGSYSGTSFFPNVVGQTSGRPSERQDILNPLLNDSLNPFGTFDVAISNDDNIEGGNANNALLPTDGTTTLSLNLLTGSLNAAALETAFLNGFSDGSLRFAARFQQVNAGAGSDKLLGGTVVREAEVPEPLTILGVGTAVAFGGAFKRKLGQKK